MSIYTYIELIKNVLILIIAVISIIAFIMLPVEDMQCNWDSQLMSLFTGIMLIWQIWKYCRDSTIIGFVELLYILYIFYWAIQNCHIPNLGFFETVCF